MGIRPSSNMHVSFYSPWCYTVHSLTNLRILELNIAIICSSMPAFSSFSKTYLAKPNQFAARGAQIVSRVSSYWSKAKSFSKSASFPPFGPTSRAAIESESFEQLHDGVNAQPNRHTNLYQVGASSGHPETREYPLRDLERNITADSLQH